ncbi:MAG: acetylxylan esterase [Bacteroidota bacterium]
MKSFYNKLSYTLLFVAFIQSYLLLAQPRQKMVDVVVAPTQENWQYKIGEKVIFRVSVLKNDLPIQDIEIRYKIGPEKLMSETTQTMVLKNGSGEIKANGMKAPGFLRCWIYATVDGKEYSGYATAGFEPEKIQPIVKMPEDFDTFWSNAKNELAEVPIDAKMTLLPERCTEKVNVYHVDIQNYPSNARLYGILSVPKSSGKYPAILRVPGAGIRPYYGDVNTAEKNIITLQIGIHGIPVNLDQSVYDNLRAGALNNYQIFNLKDRDQYYYKRVYLGCVRAVDFIFSLPEFDGSNIAVAGGSQGGALSIVTAGLDSRIKWLVPYYPALCDLVGYTEKRAGGWPHMFHPDNPHHTSDAEMKTAAYYDVVNFAKKVEAEGYYSWGFNDNVCPPTSMYAAYNVINAPKQLLLALETGHWTFPEQHETTNAWLFSKLKSE